MTRERLLIAGLVGLVLVSAGAAVVVPGVIATQSPDEDRRQGMVDVRDMAISHGTVGGERVALTVEARLQHAGAPSRNVTVLFRAVDTASGLEQSTERVSVGTLEGRREVSISATLTVPREGGYRLEAIVFQDGQRRALGRKEVRGVGSLQPAYARTNVTFHDFATGTGVDLPAIEYSIGDVAGNRTRLSVETFLTNRGSTAASGYRLVLKTRQVDSNIVAAEQSVDVSRIDPGRTVAVVTDLTVPNGYNYYLDAVLWRDGVIVATERSAASLDPTETVHVNRTERDIGLEVGDFETTDGGADRGAGAGTPPPTPVESGGAGFGVGVALVALLAAILLAVRPGDSRD